MSKLTIVCGGCRQQPYVAIDSDGAGQAVCPECGQTDNLDEVQQIAGEHLKLTAAGELQASASKPVRGRKAARAEPVPALNTEFRWQFAEV